MIILGVDPGTIKTGYGLIFKDGQIIKSGDYTLAEQLENTGYTDI